MSGFKNEDNLKIIYCAVGGTGTGSSASDPLPLADGALMDVEDGDVITGVDVAVTTAITVATVMDIGDGTDPNGYVAAGGLTAVVTTGAGALLSKRYTGADTIDLDMTGVAAAGAIAVIVKGYRV